MVASGATIPQRPPASIDMLHSVMRPSMDSARIVLAAEFDGVALRSVGADMRDDGESDVFGADPDRGGTVD